MVIRVLNISNHKVSIGDVIIEPKKCKDFPEDISVEMKKQICAYAATGVVKAFEIDIPVGVPEIIEKPDVEVNNAEVSEDRATRKNTNKKK